MISLCFSAEYFLGEWAGHYQRLRAGERCAAALLATQATWCNRYRPVPYICDDNNTEIKLVLWESVRLRCSQRWSS
jgi:hypothetical protein